MQERHHVCSLSSVSLQPLSSHPKPEHHEIKQQQKGCENHSNDHQPHSLLSDHYIGVYDYVELDYI
jgi:hypothetical protein